MKKGVVVELQDDFVILLTPDGQFLRTKVGTANYELGEEIPFLTTMDDREEAITRSGRRESFFNFQKMKLGVISALAIILIFFTVAPVFKEDRVYAYMTVDINPSFEIAVDEHLKAISLKPINKDGEKIVDEISNWKKKPVKDVIHIIISKSKEKGYVYSGKEIFLTTVYKEEDKEKKSELEKGVKQIQSSFEKSNVVVNIAETDVNTREKALEQGISTGKYLKIQSANKQKEEIKKAKEDHKEIKREVENKAEVEIKVPEKNIEQQNNNEVKDSLQKETKTKLQEVQKSLKENNRNEEREEQRQQELKKQRQKELEEQRQKELEEQNKLREKQLKEQNKKKEEEEKERENQRKKLEKQKEKESKEREKQREKFEKQQEKHREKQEKEREKQEKERYKQKDHDDDDDDDD
ncbi:anti-sigma factor domain-containing protein [Metabacillus fastidiosus]|uniref:anti-sigma factor domain-containing protein n=1 Tax=Metabacillus fastidiosus TaxID=1458 RepID=UPI000824E2FE|nr:anti-sigma factor domain-containing protein [Metabacillus fastidiosus]MED4463593.1 anti-sigma factor domain-containing protein [Metabacillus fastidiosus]